MENCYGQHGWKEFHRNRKNILDEFDKLLDQIQTRPVKVAHGEGVEAYLRKWLSEFLPKKYGVTSGYIIPRLYDEISKIYHFDIIIYNQLDAPVLWTEGNEDQNEQGKYRAIPAEHVVALYEVKSRLTKSNVSDALKKLKQTNSFSEQLHQHYTCGIIFIDLKETDKNKQSIMEELIKGKDVFGFSGGMVLRYEGDHSCTASINIFKNEKNKAYENTHCKPLARPIDDLNIYQTEDRNIHLGPGVGAEFVATSNGIWSVTKMYTVDFHDCNTSVYLSWSRSGFSTFCMDLLRALDGLPCSIKNERSFGRIFDTIEARKAPLQGALPESGKPFLGIKLYEGGEHGDKLQIDCDATEPTIKFMIFAENHGDVAAILSDDAFRNKCELAAGASAIHSVLIRAKLPDGEKGFLEYLKEAPLELGYRLVYYSANDDKEFYALERTLKITDSDIEFV